MKRNATDGSSQPRIRVVSADNDAGLSRSADIFAQALRSTGMEVTISLMSEGPRETPNAQTPPRFEANVFLERIVPDFFSTAPRNFLIPNQEWFLEKDRQHLDEIDCVLCKTNHARKIFDELGCSTTFIGFTSEDRLDAAVEPDYDRFFHLAGRSLKKGTRRLIRLWETHPEWPHLTVVQHPETPLEVQADNITYISDYLDMKDLRRYQNRLGVHLCPSEAEGFGHYIVEAMSCRAVVITTDAPPMNELVRSDRGLLVDYCSSEPHYLGTRYFFDPDALVEAVERISNMETSEKRRIGQRARSWYKTNDRCYYRRTGRVMRELLGSPGTR